MRKITAMAVTAITILATASGAIAQQYPTQTIKMIVAFGAGGGSDIVSRIIAQRLQERLGQPVIIENRPGAGGLIGNEAVANAPKDGYTIANMSAGQIIGAAMTKQMKFHPVDAFDPIAQVAEAGLLIVTRPDYPAKTVQELVALAKAKPDEIVFASPGFGATQHLAAELFMQVAGIKMRHVPFRTSPDAITALLGKQVDVLFDTVTALIGQVQAKELTAIAVTGKDRFPAVPDVPTVMESGVMPGYDVATWYGFFGPRGMPADVVKKLNGEMNAIIKEPAVAERLTKVGVVVKGSTPEAFGALLASEYKKWDDVRTKANLQQR
jgi:tripartite-type tricarboxylate transporter receptor subunit TctC